MFNKKPFNPLPLIHVLWLLLHHCETQYSDTQLTDRVQGTESMCNLKEPLQEKCSISQVTLTPSEIVLKVLSLNA